MFKKFREATKVEKVESDASRVVPGETKARPGSFHIGYSLMALVCLDLAIYRLVPLMSGICFAGFWAIFTIMFTNYLITCVDITYRDIYSCLSLAIFNVWKRLMLSSRFKIVRFLGLFENTIQNTICGLLGCWLNSIDFPGTFTTTALALLVPMLKYNLIAELVINAFMYFFSVFGDFNINIEHRPTEWFYSITHGGFVKRGENQPTSRLKKIAPRVFNCSAVTARLRKKVRERCNMNAARENL